MGVCLSNNQKTTLNFYIGQRNTTLSDRLPCHVLIIILQPKYNIRQIGVNYNEMLFNTHCKKGSKYSNLLLQREQWTLNRNITQHKGQPFKICINYLKCVWIISCFFWGGGGSERPNLCETALHLRKHVYLNLKCSVPKIPGCLVIVIAWIL